MELKKRGWWQERDVIFYFNEYELQIHGSSPTNLSNKKILELSNFKTQKAKYCDFGFDFITSQFLTIIIRALLKALLYGIITW